MGKDENGAASLHSPSVQLEQATTKGGSSPEPTELVYILGCSFWALRSFSLHLPPFLLLLSSTLRWGHEEETGCCCAGIALPAMQKPTDEEEWSCSPGDLTAFPEEWGR